MITPAGLKTYLKITDCDQSVNISLAISNAKGFLEAYLWYDLELNASRIAFFWSQYRKQFQLDFTNINSVSEIKYASDEFNPTWIAYDTAEDFKVYLDEWVVRTRDCIWPFTQITYSFWYDEDTCPNDLKAILYEIAAMSFKNMWEIAIWDLNSETVDGDSVAFKATVWSLSPNASILLDKYKIYEFSS